MREKELKRSSIVLSVILSIIFFGILGVLIFASQRSLRVKIVRVELCLIVYAFLLANCLCDREKLYSFLFKKRWFIYGLLVLFFVINKINFSSVACFDGSIQPGEGSDLIYPIFGYARGIRSDEWLVSIPRMMTAEYTNYGVLNNIPRAVTTSNMSASGLQLDYASLCKPIGYLYYLLGSEYGLAFNWSYKLIMGFAFCFELFLILTKESKLVSFFGAILLWFSPFNMWWSMSLLLMAGCAIIVLFYYFIIQKNSLHRLGIGVLLAIAGADFVTDLYPAWQVPMGFIILSLMAWVLITNDNWKHFTKIDWLVFVVDVIFMISIIGRYLYIDMDYIESVQKTIYPGSRVEYGGMAIPKLLGYFTSELSIFGGVSNPCEIGTIYGAFPLGLILMVYVQIREKGKNTLLWCLSVPTLMLLTYCTIGLPPLVCKLVLLTNSTSARATDFLGVLAAIGLIVSLAEMKKQKILLPFWGGCLISVFCSFIACRYSLQLIEDGRFRYPVIVLAVITAIGIAIIISNVKKERISKWIMVTSGTLLLGASLCIHPFMIGLDVINSKPVAKEIKEILSEDPNSKWIAVGGIVTPNYLIACGAPTVNSVNYVPNYEMWSLLDPDKKYEEVWNRYAHMAVSLSDDGNSNYLLNSPDCMTMVLNKEDFDKLNIDYVFTQYSLQGEWAEYFTEIYNEAGCWIYKVK